MKIKHKIAEWFCFCCCCFCNLSIQLNSFLVLQFFDFIRRFSKSTQHHIYSTSVRFIVSNSCDRIQFCLFYLVCFLISYLQQNYMVICICKASFWFASSFFIHLRGTLRNMCIERSVQSTISIFFDLVCFVCWFVCLRENR